MNELKYIRTDAKCEHGPDGLPLCPACGKVEFSTELESNRVQSAEPGARYWYCHSCDVVYP